MVYISNENSYKVLDSIYGRKKFWTNARFFLADFNTLFTALPHHEIINELNWLIDLLFNNTKK